MLRAPTRNVVSSNLQQLSDVFRPARDADETRIHFQVRSAHLLEEPAPVSVGIGRHANESIRGSVWTAPLGQHARGSGLAEGRLEMLSVEVLHQIECDHRLKHGDLDEAASPGSLAREESGQYGVRCD